MDSIPRWLLEQPHFVSFLQIVLDLLLVLFVAVLFLRRSKENRTAGRELSRALEEVLQQTETIAREFDENLRERRELMGQVMAALDDKINQAKTICKNLEKVEEIGRQGGLGRRHGSSRDQENQAIVHLAQKGLSAVAIAEHLKKPLGEIELVLSLKRLRHES
ncbi:DUF6115 domain-containing protein [Desulfoferrobacter suflitae]|uniref:DUF6115 domain-containing protein n=1 Tax=Desulfoferrobacter suflitae TaxID=2865782 RepID=UPI0021647D18|nr:hypothetical protein [Desulfoferrobacter suflitae]MCK8602419.1 hypothetical protein [Desulfoferrobacter suflitae]